MANELIQETAVSKVQEEASCSSAQQSRTEPLVAFNCVGAESDPTLRQQLLEMPIEVEADQLILQENLAVYEGDVSLRHNCIALAAGNASLNIEKRIVRLSGDVNMKLPGADLKGDGASFSLADNSSSLTGASYRIDAQPSVYGGADEISMDAERRVRINNGSYTRCEPDDKDWEVTASKIKLDPQSGQGSARNAVVRVAGVPIMYVPYMRFPISGQRQSGFLFPEITQRSEGLDLVIPYYFNLAPNYDLLYRARYKEGSGYLTELNTRWLNRYDSWEIGGLFIDSDNAHPTSENGGDSRWQFSVKEASVHRGHWQTDINISRTSDADVLRDLQTNQFSASRSSALASSGSVRWFDEWGEVGVAIENYQSIDPLLEVPTEKRPEFWSDVFVPIGSSRAVFSSDAIYTLFDSDALSEQLGSGRADRLTGSISVLYPFAVAGSELEVRLGSDYRYYSLNSRGASVLNGDKTAWVNVPFAQLTWGSSWFSYKDNGGLATLSPGVSVRARLLETGEQFLSSLPVFDSAFASDNSLLLYSDQLTVGGDFIETRDTARVSMVYTVQDKHRQRLRAELGVLNYFARSLANGIVDSEQNGGVREQQWFWSGDWRFRPHWHSSMQLIYSQDSEKLDLGSVAIRYLAANRTAASEKLKPLLNVGYHYRRDGERFLAAQDVELADISGVLPIGSQWGLMARFQYDIENTRHTEALAGFEFDDCCVKFRLVYRDGIIYDADLTEGERDRAIVAQIQLKGLGGIGNAVESLLQESIRGFASY